MNCTDFLADAPCQLSVGGDEFELCPLAAEHLAELVAVEQRSHAYPWSRGNLLASLGSHVVVGLRHRSQLAAYAVLSFVAGEAELLLVVVDQPWQNRGLGRALLLHLLALSATRAQMMFLEVRPSNQRALALYESLGFNQVGTRPRYYPATTGQREDAWLYALDLGSLESF